MSDLDDLYQDVILHHSKSPRNKGAIAGARFAEGYNPLCGDHFTVWLDLEDGRVRRAGFDGSGCAISTASASLMTEAVKGLTEADALALFEQVHGLVTGVHEPTEDLGKLAVFGGVRNFPLRVKCATLAWHTMKAAFKGQNDVVSTE